MTLRNLARLLAERLGFKISRDPIVPEAFKSSFERGLRDISHNKSPFASVIREFRYGAGHHPESYKDYECAFAAGCLAESAPQIVLDVGSYRHFIIGLMAHYLVTTIDVRPRTTALPTETLLTCDAKKLAVPDGTFDAVVSLCAVEHFGLGRYGDDFDLSGDVKGFQEMIRVLKPGGSLIFTTTITGGASCIAFNAHRIYDHALILQYCKDLNLVRESFFSVNEGRFCLKSELSVKQGDYDVYCGWFRKK